jgi:hypothetical protein
MIISSLGRAGDPVDPYKADKHDYYYVQLYFDADRFTVTHQHEVQLRSLISKSISQGEIQQIEIAAWPASELGDKRENEIKKYLRAQYPALRVPDTNMADDSEALKKFIKYTNISNQRSLEEDWILDTGTYFPKADQVKSKAIVFAVLKGPFS